MNKYNSLPKGTKSIAPAFGYSSFSIANLTIYTFKVRMRESGYMYQAFEYVRKMETEVPPLSKSSKLDNKNRMYITYSVATADAATAFKITRAFETAAGYTLMQKADEKLGTKNAPPFLGTVKISHESFDNYADELPF